MIWNSIDTNATNGKFVIKDLEYFVACQLDGWIIEFLSLQLAHELWGSCEHCQGVPVTREEFEKLKADAFESETISHLTAELIERQEKELQAYRALMPKVRELCVMERCPECTSLYMNHFHYCKFEQIKMLLDEAEKA